MGAFVNEFSSFTYNYLLRLRTILVAMPARPVPRSSIEDGSGTEETPLKPTSANPVSAVSPQFEPTTKRKWVALMAVKLKTCGGRLILPGTCANDVGPPARGVKIVPSVEVNTCTSRIP